jgi:hypothetical protein
MSFSFRHFTEVLRVKNANGQPPVLIGGQAVNYWAELYSIEEPDLLKWRPFTSEDIDFQGNREDVRAIGVQLGRAPLYPRPVEMTALAGMIPLQLGNLKSQIEIIRSVPGVPTKLLQESALESAWEQYLIRVIDPISLLCAKTHLALKVQQSDRRDVEHVAIMLICVRAFLRGALLKVEGGVMPVRGWLAAAERVLTLSESATGGKTERRFQLDWANALPLQEIQRAAAGRLVAFREKRLRRWQTNMESRAHYFH